MGLPDELVLATFRMGSCNSRKLKLLNCWEESPVKCLVQRNVILPIFHYLVGYDAKLPSKQTNDWPIVMFGLLHETVNLVTRQCS